MIEAAYTGPERVEHDGTAYTGPNAEGDLARALIGQGVDPTTPLTFSRDGRPALRGTVGAFAARAWGGNGADPQFKRWQPHPMGSYASPLMTWHSLRPPPGLRGKPGHRPPSAAPERAPEDSQ